MGTHCAGTPVGPWSGIWFNNCAATSGTWIHMSNDVVDSIRERIWSECDAPTIIASGDRAPAMVRDLAAGFLREARVVVGSGQAETIIDAVVAATLGLGPLDELLADTDISEIMVNGPDQVYVERHGRMERVDIAFTDDEHVRQVVDRILAPINRRLDALSPMVDARLPDGSRVNAVIPPLAVDGCSVTIRRFLGTARTLADLERLGAIDAAGAESVTELIASRANVLVAGATSSGKTTMLSAALGTCDVHDRIIIIEDSTELAIDRPHRIRLEARGASIEAHGEVRVRDLVRNALRMRPDRIVVGEVRGDEAFDLVQAMSTGHRGCWSTVHANGPDDALLRLEAMALSGAVTVPASVIRAQLARAFDAVIFLHRRPDGSRAVAHIDAVHAHGRGHEADWRLTPLWTSVHT